MVIRPATVEDVPAIREIARTTWHATYDDIVGDAAVDEQVEEWYAPETVTEGVTREEWPYLVAEDGGTVLGYATGGPTTEGPADAVVAAIYVRPEQWGEGHGSVLLERLHERLRDLGCEDVRLAVLADNYVGRSFYERHGYECHERRTTEVGGVEAEGLVLRRSL